MWRVIKDVVSMFLSVILRKNIQMFNEFAALLKDFVSVVTSTVQISSMLSRRTMRVSTRQRCGPHTFTVKTQSTSLFVVLVLVLTTSHALSGCMASYIYMKLCGLLRAVLYLFGSKSKTWRDLHST
ncbi:hypothetical protein PanWU01x14_201150 [Parasponia andersonii]|uniref:Transmembrane protein n=1 Tax=Parasponia andersonii TaxID=3476 RepID=A0A2P5BXM5_PARAD|nr:hypothetical protein PanWU01x14_201150 [Parasponia andersonii]